MGTQLQGLHPCQLPQCLPPCMGRHPQFVLGSHSLDFAKAGYVVTNLLQLWGCAVGWGQEGRTVLCSVCPFITHLSVSTVML